MTAGWWWCNKCRGNNRHFLQAGHTVCACGYKRKLHERQQDSSEATHATSVRQELRSVDVGPPEVDGYRIIGAN